MKKRVILPIMALCGAVLFTACDISALLGTQSSQSSRPNKPLIPGVTCGHTDENYDDVCDDCGTGVAVTFDIISVNDLHGKFADTATQPGVDELSTYIKQTRAQNENTIVLSTGDMWQGAPESNLTKGLIMTEWMNEMNFVAMAMGNHEYDWGEEYIKENADLADFSFLAINIYDRDTNALVDYCQPSVMVEQSGVKIGIIGAIGDCYSSISGDKSQEVYFKTGEQLTALVKAESNELRSRGADCIVYAVHEGQGGYDVSLSDGYVDIVFEGHSHQSYTRTDAKGVYHLQGGGDNEGISHAKLSVNYVNDTVKTKQAKVVSSSAYSHLSDDPIVEKLLDKYADQIETAGKVLGRNDRLRRSDELLQKCAQLYLQAGEERWGGQYDLFLGGGFMSARAPYDLAAGEVLYGDLQNILPFDNQLVLCSIKGKELKSQFLFTNNSRYYIDCSEYGNEMLGSISDTETYYLVTDTYSSTYAPNKLTEIERYDETTFARDLLAKFIEEGGYGTNTVTLSTIPELIAIGSSLPKNSETAEKYFVKAKIASIDNDYYGNATLEDEERNTLFVYGISDKNGMRYGEMYIKPQVGGTVILEGTVKRYVPTEGEEVIELYFATLYSIE